MSSDPRYILQVVSPGYGAALDLGGGSGTLRGLLTRVGYHYVNLFHGSDIYRYTPKGLRHLLRDFEIILFDSPLWVFSIFGTAGVEFLKCVHLGFANFLVERLTGFLDHHLTRHRKQPASFAAAYRIVARKPNDEQ